MFIRPLIAAFPFALMAPLSLFAQEPAATAPKLPPQKDFYVIILAGQSNMAGRGNVEEEGKKAHPRIFALNIENQWQPAVDPLHWDKKGAGAGLGKPFAEKILPTLPKDAAIGLVPTACGGSPIATWEPGKYWDQTKSNPYDDFLARSKRALQDGTLKAILWHQGEGDANPRSADAYEEKLTALIARMRADLNAPEVPFIVGQLGRFPAKPWDASREKIDAALRAVAAKVRNVYYVSAEGLMSRGDNLHFDTESLRTLGRGYADAYLKNASTAPAAQP